MRKHVLALLAATALAGTAAPALAQSVNERQANIEQRINTGVRNGALTQAEATRLRADLRAIADLEVRYRRDGLSAAERIDLDGRLDALNQRIRIERNDRDERGGGAYAGSWEPIRQREIDFNQRVDDGMRRGNLNRNEADRLRRDYTAFANLAQQYRNSGGGYSAAERSELQRRYDFLLSQIRYDQADFEPISRRIPDLERRIEIGIRNGQLTRNEANQLRQDLRELERLEDSYRRSDGRLETREKADLDRRFAVIRTRIFNERTDNDTRGGERDWWAMSDRSQNLERRIDAGVRNRTITQAEAARLRSEWRYIVQLEANYRRDGLSRSERADLERRFDILAAKIRWERNDWQNRR
jgi:tetrahydromethanopterin S-methyltransferase subunit G